MERKPRSGNSRRGADRPKPEFEQKTIAVRRVARVMAGGRRFSFAVAVVIGDRAGRIGLGLGKGGDTALAVDKAYRQARRDMFTVPLVNQQSIAHEVAAKYNSARVVIRPAPGRGLVAGSAVRAVLDLAGVRDVSSKILSRSKNQINNARAAIAALKQL